MSPKNKTRKRPSFANVPLDTYIGYVYNIDKEDLVGLKQFTTNDGKKFYPSGSTVENLLPGYYEILFDNYRGLFFEKLDVKTDGLLRFPETNLDIVIDEISKFWEREEYFKKYNLNYKRGIFLYGPPGSGKTSTIQLVCEDVIKRNGVIFKFQNPVIFCDGVRAFREIQPNTPIVVLLEDIDSILERNNESEILNVLDGIDQSNKILYLATSNYPEKLGKRVLNRPSRFDKRFKVGHPKKESRRLYFDHLLDEELVKENKIDIDKWVKDTEDMSIAHLKELFIAVCILGNSYEESIKVLKDMNEVSPSSDEDYFDKIGFHR